MRKVSMLFNRIACCMMAVAPAAVGAGADSCDDLEDCGERITIPAPSYPIVEGTEALIGVLTLPEGANAQAKVPGCLVLHGSGGLFVDREDENGNGQCPSTLGNVQGKFAAVALQLRARGVAALLPSSFVSRDAGFCEDNSDEYVFRLMQSADGGAPFFYPRDEEHMDEDELKSPRTWSPYKYRRTAIRVLDALVSMEYLCQRPEVDCSRTCIVGASNGGTAILGYSAMDLQRHVVEYLDVGTEARPGESSGALKDRGLAFAPMQRRGSSEELAGRLAARPLPRFVQAVSPGCALRNLVPNVDDPNDAGVVATDLYYPQHDVELHIEIGTSDDVPGDCYFEAGVYEEGEGERWYQALAFEGRTGIDPSESRYLVETYAGAGHDLFGQRTDSLRDKLDFLVDLHFFGPGTDPGRACEIFCDGFDAVSAGGR